MAASTETFAVALVGKPTGWLVEAVSAEEVLEAHEAGRNDLLVCPERFYRDRYLLGHPMPASWALL